jgi:hypothetical protein
MIRWAREHGVAAVRGNHEEQVRARVRFWNDIFQFMFMCAFFC